MSDETLLRTAFPAMSFQYRPEGMPDDYPERTIEVLPIKVEALARFADAIVRIASLLQGGKTVADVVKLAGEEVSQILSPLVTVRGFDDIPLAKMPAGVIPEALRLVIASSLPGKWEEAGREIAEKLGLKDRIGEFLARGRTAIANDLRSMSSETSSET